MQYDDLFDRAMSYVPAEWQFLVVLCVLATVAVCAVLYVRPARRQVDLSGLMRVIGDQATTASAIQRDLSSVREHARHVEDENQTLRQHKASLEASIGKLESDVRQLIQHCRTMIRMVRKLDAYNDHETDLREIEIKIEHIANRR